MSKIPIVDNDDVVVGYKDRKDVLPEDIYRVSALWIKNSEGESLLAQRAFSKTNDPGKWGPAVAGTVEEGENYDINIRKEAQEEIGISDISMEKGPKERIFGEHNYFVQWYTARIDKGAGEFVIDKDEVSEVRWFSKKDLMRESESNTNDFLSGTKRWIELFL